MSTLYKLVLILFTAMLSHTLSGQEVSQYIHIDQFGYLPSMPKVAVISNPIEGYNAEDIYLSGLEMEVRNSLTDEIVYTGPLAPWNDYNTDLASGDQGLWFDFSNVTEPGSYYLIDQTTQARTGDFIVSDDVYADVMKASTRMFYYNRCGDDKPEIYAGTGYADSENFSQDQDAHYIYEPLNDALALDLSGGWFDAGDYNKYVTFTGSVVHNLLWAYTDYPAAFSDATNIPESGNGIADLLDELKWELDWLLKMNQTDGNTINKLGSQNFAENTLSPPSANNDPRFYGPTCTSAAISVAGSFAHAAKIYQDIPGMSDYADTLAARAIQTWATVLPMINSMSLESDCDDGSIVAGDSDMTIVEQLEWALIAAVHLFDLTGDSSYNQYVADHIMDAEPVSVPFWGPYKMPLQDALVHYGDITGHDADTYGLVLGSVSSEIINNYNDFYGFSENDLYRSFMPDWSYHWGSNLPKAGYGVLNHMLVEQALANDPAGFVMKGQEQLHYFHGVNPQGLVYLSNMYDYGAERSVNEIYHTWFYDGTDYDHALNSAIGPAPGFLSGGPNNSFSVTTLSPPSGQPDSKSYLDYNTGFPDNSWEISEPAIYYQAMYVRLLARYTNIDTQVGLISYGANSSSPTLSMDGRIVRVSSFEQNHFDLHAMSGQLLKSGALNTSGIIDLGALPAGVYLLTIDGHVFSIPLVQ